MRPQSPLNRLPKLGFAFICTITALWFASTTLLPSQHRVKVPDGRGGFELVDVHLPRSYYKQNVRTFYGKHVRRMYEPWICLRDTDAVSTKSGQSAASRSDFCHRPITSASLTALEWLAKGGAYRIRFTGSKILYRPLVVFGQTYRVQRLEWIMSMIDEMNAEGLLTRRVDGRDGK